MADFLTVNLNTILKNQTSTSNTVAANVPQAASEKGTKKLTADEWEALLKSRLESNNKLGPEARESEYDIENKFFKEFFKAEFDDATIVNQLMLIGEPLKKVIKAYGFDKHTNPILAFISTDFVLETIIKTKLLNESTFKAIYNAVAQKLIAHSQFLKPNDYNIIYYPDLYKKSSAEIIEYLKLQSTLLMPGASRYTVEDLIKNKKVFIALPNITGKTFAEKRDQINNTEVDVHFGDDKIESVKAEIANAKLNSIKLAKMLAGKPVASITTNTQNKTAAKSVLVKKLDTTAKKLAAVQFVNMVSNSAEAKKALTNKAFAEVSSNDLLKATFALSGYMPKKAITDAEADEFIKQILSGL